jgi:hypothetical protein
MQLHLHLQGSSSLCIKAYLLKMTWLATATASAIQQQRLCINANDEFINQYSSAYRRVHQSIQLSLSTQWRDMTGYLFTIFLQRRELLSILLVVNTAQLIDAMTGYDGISFYNDASCCQYCSLSIQLINAMTGYILKWLIERRHSRFTTKRLFRDIIMSQTSFVLEQLFTSCGTTRRSSCVDVPVLRGDVQKNIVLVGSDVVRVILNDADAQKNIVLVGSSTVLWNKDSEDNIVVLFVAHEESMLSWNGSCLITEGYRLYWQTRLFNRSGTIVEIGWDRSWWERYD